jgi:hypothetical protein
VSWDVLVVLPPYTFWATLAISQRLSRSTRNHLETQPSELTSFLVHRATTTIFIRGRDGKLTLLNHSLITTILS